MNKKGERDGEQTDMHTKGARDFSKKEVSGGKQRINKLKERETAGGGKERGMCEETESNERRL